MNYKQEKLKIGFVGNMNTMPMMIALKCIESGYDVKYVVDQPPKHTLHRPEFHYSEISYPYPEWIIESILTKYQRYLIPVIPKLLLRKLIRDLEDRDVIFFNDYAFQISKYFPKDIIKVALFSGSDLADHANKNYPIYTLKKKGIKKYLYFLVRFIQVLRQRKGIQSCHIISYFPKGMSLADDKLIQDLMKNHRYIDVRRYGILNYKALGLEFSGAKETEFLNILIPVRFLISPENDDEYKGNDLIIKAISNVYKTNKKIKVHFFEKGSEEEIRIAKEMCSSLAIEPIVQWHPELPMNELLELYKDSDIVIDQVGNHWPGAIAFIGLHMGKPVITNINRDVCDSYWGERCPILIADDVESITSQIEACFDYNYRDNVGQQSYAFSRKYIGPDFYFKNCIEAIEHVRSHFNDFQR